MRDTIHELESRLPSDWEECEKFYELYRDEPLHNRFRGASVEYAKHYIHRLPDAERG